jgi:hypothetical protein
MLSVPLALPGEVGAKLIVKVKLDEGGRLDGRAGKFARVNAVFVTLIAPTVRATEPALLTRN